MNKELNIINGLVCLANMFLVCFLSMRERTLIHISFAAIIWVALQRVILILQGEKETYTAQLKLMLQTWGFVTAPIFVVLISIAMPTLQWGVPAVLSYFFFDGLIGLFLGTIMFILFLQMKLSSQRKWRSKHMQSFAGNKCIHLVLFAGCYFLLNIFPFLRLYGR